MKIQQILKELEELEKNFFIPVNAHPLKKITDLKGNDQSIMSRGEEDSHIPMSAHYK